MTPRIPPIYYGEYVNGQQRIRAVEYNQTTRAWTVTPQAVAHVAITDRDILIDDDYALFVSQAGAIDCAVLTNRIFAADFPRLEFYRQADSVPRRFASVSQLGVLSVLDCNESDDPIDGTDRMFLPDSDSSIGLDGLQARLVGEVRVLTDAQTGALLALMNGAVLTI